MTKAKKKMDELTEKRLHEWLEEQVPFIESLDEEVFPSFIAALIHGWAGGDNLTAVMLTSKLTNFFATQLHEQVVRVEMVDGTEKVVH